MDKIIGMVMNIGGYIVLWGLFLVAFKSLSGYHFPWEVCSCCGKKYLEHKKDKK